MCASEQNGLCATEQTAGGPAVKLSLSTANEGVWIMNSNLLRGLRVSLETTAIMRYTVVLAIAQVLCVILFAAWMFSLW